MIYEAGSVPSTLLETLKPPVSPSPLLEPRPRSTGNSWPKPDYGMFPGSGYIGDLYNDADGNCKGIVIKTRGPARVEVMQRGVVSVPRHCIKGENIQVGDAIYADPCSGRMALNSLLGEIIGHVVQLAEDMVNIRVKI